MGSHKWVSGARLVLAVWLIRGPFVIGIVVIVLGNLLYGDPVLGQSHLGGLPAGGYPHLFVSVRQVTFDGRLR